MKAQIYLIESIVAIAMMASIFLLIFSLTQKTQMSQDRYKYEILMALEELKVSGSLRTYALGRNTNQIEEYLEGYLPLEVKVSIFNLTSNLTPMPNLPETDVIVVSYYLVGDYGKFEPLEVRVYAW